MNKQNRIIVIGGSAGSLEVLIQILTELDNNHSVSVFIVVHGSSKLTDILKSKTQRTQLKVSLAKEDDIIKSGHVYVAPPDRHLLIQEDRIRVNNSPPVNRNRPSIDLLFRSSAVAHKTQIIGILLSGLLSDGTAGLKAVVQCGGFAVVQDPADALYPDMPENAIEGVEADYIVPASIIGEVVNKILASPVKPDTVIPQNIAKENRLDLENNKKHSLLDEFGSPIPISCPQCGGPLWQVEEENENPRFRCHVGHNMNTQILLKEQDEGIEETLRIALRIIEEKLHMQEKISESWNGGGKSARRDIIDKRITETKTQMDRLRNLLLDL